MIFTVVKTVTAEFTKEEREILKEANSILTYLANHAKEAGDLPMTDEDVDILDNLYDHINIVEDFAYRK